MPNEPGRPICRAVGPSAPAELAWILDLLTQTAPYATPALSELDHSLLPGIARLRGTIGDRFRALFDEDGLAGCPELLLVAHQAQAVIAPDLAQTFAWLEGRAQPVHDHELLTEPQAARNAVNARVARLSSSAETRRGYRQVLGEVWELARAPWERAGLATVKRACETWRSLIDTGTSIEELVPPRHPLTRSDELGFEDLFAYRVEFALSPLYFCVSGGHVADLDDFVHIAVPASDLLPIRKVRDAAFVADRLRVLAEPTRVHIVIQLLSAPSGVMELSRALRVSQATVSGHIKILRRSGLVQQRKLGGRTVFAASRKRIERWLEDARGTLARWD